MEKKKYPKCMKYIKEMYRYKKPIDFGTTVWTAVMPTDTSASNYAGFEYKIRDNRN